MIFRGLATVLICGLTLVPAQADENILSASVAPPDISFQIYSGFLIVVPGRIGEERALRVAIDTGATHSVVNNALALRLGTPIEGEAIFSLDRLVNTGWAEVPEVQIGPLIVRNLAVRVADLAYLRALGVNVDAVIGLDVLRDCNFSIDYRHKKIRFGDSQPLKSSVRMDLWPSFVSIQLHLGQQAARVVLDSGTRGILMYESRVSWPLLQAPVQAHVSASAGAGQVDLRQVIAPRVRVGNTDLDRNVLLIRSSAPPTNPVIDGYLGTSVLGNRVNFDFQHNRLSWSD